MTAAIQPGSSAEQAKLVMVFDTETTGLPTFKRGGAGPIANTSQFYSPTDVEKYNSARLLELGYGLYNSEGDLVRHYESIVKPDGFEVACTHIHGITSAMAEEGEPLVDVFRRFKEDLACVDVLVAHNIEFDINVVLAECYRIGDTELADLMMAKEHKCTKKMGNARFKGKPGRLTDLYGRLFGDIEQKHRAFSDVVMCAKCYFALI